MSLGPAEILVIFVIALLVFGPNRLPEVGRQVGKGVRELRKFQQMLKSDLDEVLADDVSDHAEPAPQLPPLPAPVDGATVPPPDTPDVAPTPEVVDVSQPPTQPPDPT